MAITCFFADVGFTVGKLFPTTYNCRSLDCAKIVHNCVMTLCSFPFISGEGYALRNIHAHARVRRLGWAQTNRNIHHEESDAKGGADGPIVKVLEILVSLAYVVYDAVTQDPPGTGTTALIVVTCLAEIFLIYQEYVTIYRYGGLKVRTISPEPSPCTPKP